MYYQVSIFALILLRQALYYSLQSSQTPRNLTNSKGVIIALLSYIIYLGVAQVQVKYINLLFNLLNSILYLKAYFLYMSYMFCKSYMFTIILQLKTIILVLSIKPTIRRPFFSSSLYRGEIYKRNSISNISKPYKTFIGIIQSFIILLLK